MIPMPFARPAPASVRPEKTRTVRGQARIPRTTHASHHGQTWPANENHQDGESSWIMLRARFGSSREPARPLQRQGSAGEEDPAGALGSDEDEVGGGAPRRDLDERDPLGSPGRRAAE